MQEFLDDHNIDDILTIEEFDKAINALQETCDHIWFYNIADDENHCTACGLTEDM